MKRYIEYADMFDQEGTDRVDCKWSDILWMRLQWFAYGCLFVLCSTFLLQGLK